MRTRANTCAGVLYAPLIPEPQAGLSVGSSRDANRSIEAGHRVAIRLVYAHKEYQ